MGEKNKILITGGAGFIGTHLTVRFIEEGRSVVILDSLSPQIHGDVKEPSHPIFKSKQVSFINGSVLDRDLVSKSLKGVDAIVHLAAETGTAQSMYQIARYNNVNSQGTAVMLDVLANEDNDVKKIVLSSSRSIYGEGAYSCSKCGDVYPEARNLRQLEEKDWALRCPKCTSDKIKLIATKESAKIQSASVYAATKYAQEELVRVSCGALGITPFILRFQNVYGAGQSLANPYTGILSIFSTRIRRGLDLAIFEDGKISRDFVYVSDVVEAICLSIDSKIKSQNPVYNVGSGVASPIMEVANLLVKHLDGNIKPTISEQFRLGDIRHCFADISLIQKDLGFEAKVSLDAGIRMFVDWVLKQPLPEDGLERANKELKDRGMMN